MSKAPHKKLCRALGCMKQPRRMTRRYPYCAEHRDAIKRGYIFFHKLPGDHNGTHFYTAPSRGFRIFHA